MKWIALLIFLLMVTPVVAQQQPWCGIQVLYFQHNSTTTPAGYEELINYPSGNAEEDENVTITSADGWKLIDSYITPENALSQTQEDLAGLRRYRYYTYVSTASGITQLNFTPLLRTPDGGETYFYSALSDDINDLTVNEYLTSHVSQTSLVIHNSTDRIVIKVYARTTHPSPVTVHWVYQGSTHTSHVESGYFVCEEAATQSAYAYQPPTVPLNAGIPCIAIAFVMLAFALRKH